MSLAEELARFKDKPIEDTVEFLFLYGLSQKVREIGIEKKVMLCAFGIHPKKEQQKNEIRTFCLFSLRMWRTMLPVEGSLLISRVGGFWENT